jgi:hypothetical protein
MDGPLSGPPPTGKLSSLKSEHLDSGLSLDTGLGSGSPSLGVWEHSQTCLQDVSLLVNNSDALYYLEQPTCSRRGSFL